MRRVAWGLGALGVIATTVWAGVGWEAYRLLPAAPTAWRTISNGSEDSADMDTAIDQQRTRGNPRACLSATFTDSAATATVICGLYNGTAGAGGSYSGIAIITTITAGSTQRSGLLYDAEEILSVSTRGATHYDWRVVSVSAGDCAIRAWTYGADSAVAE